MAAGDPLNGWEGTITFTIATVAHVLDFVGAWSAVSKRDIKKQKPYITATSTGTSVKTQGSKELTGSVTGIVKQGADAARQAVINAHTDGTLADLALVQLNGLTVSCPGAIISGLKLDTDSEGDASIEFSFENGAQDYTITETA